MTFALIPDWPDARRPRTVRYSRSSKKLKKGKIKVAVLLKKVRSRSPSLSFSLSLFPES